MNDMTVSKTILEQFGGHRFIAMTGAKNFVGGADTLAFSLPSVKDGANKGANKVRVTLTADDDYTVELFRIRGTQFATLATVERVQAENLRDVFTSLTGLYCTLGTLGR